ncbi:MAG: DNA primase [Verrucomicrobia bacterium GWC2_42_7]|nr:MAG: DNA primase [Verrucomicrobia bacterium GWC2_42_7]
MAIIKRTCIDSIKDKVNILDVVSPYVVLKRVGASWRGLSPFNNEKTPSFFVHSDKNIFKCFSTNNAGDIFRFIQLKENLSFSESVEFIARKFNISLEYESGGGTQQNVSLKKELFDIHAVATEFFVQQFFENNADGEKIRKYWEDGRHFSLEVAKEFNIGFSPPNASSLAKYVCRKPFSLESLKQSGLFYFREQETDPLKFRSRFRGRLVIPIRDIQGRVVAFSARQTSLTPQDDSSFEAKYINSPETPIFTKGHLWFNLDRARTAIKDTERFLMVEGQLDAIRCWVSCLHCVIAPQGTGITENQLNMLLRYSPKVDCLLDGDRAGQKAAFRILPLALKIGLDIRFLVLPEDSDPDELLQTADGLARFNAIREQAKDPINFAIDLFFAGKQNISVPEKTEILNKIFEIISHCESNTNKLGYLNEAIAKLGIDRQSAEKDFWNYLNKKTSHRVEPPIERDVKEKSHNRKLTSLEYEVLLLMLNYEYLDIPFSHTINPDWIEPDTMQGRLLVRFLDEIREGNWHGVKHLDELLSDDNEKNYIASLRYEDVNVENPIQAANACIRALYQNFIKKRITHLNIEINSTPFTHKEKLHQLQLELMKLRQLLTKNIPAIQITPIKENLTD